MPERGGGELVTAAELREVVAFISEFSVLTRKGGGRRRPDCESERRGPGTDDCHVGRRTTAG
jgi:hypothetical protein